MRTENNRTKGARVYKIKECNTQLKEKELW